MFFFRVTIVVRVPVKIVYIDPKTAENRFQMNAYQNEHINVTRDVDLVFKFERQNNTFTEILIFFQRPKIK